MDVKVKVFVNHKPIGWLRLLAGESVISASLAKATKFNSETASHHMSCFAGPDRETSRGAEPVVTFQLCRI